MGELSSITTMDLTSGTVNKAKFCDLEMCATTKGIKYLLPVTTSFKTDVRGPLIPVKASKHLMKEGYAIYGKQHYKKETGDAEIFALPDPNTLIQLPWKPHVGWVLCNLYQNGQPMSQCPRHRLAEITQHAAKLGFSMQSGIEPEFILLKKSAHEGLDDNETDGVDHHSVRSSLQKVNFLSRVVDVMEDLGWGPYRAEHEAMCNQYEINFQYADVQATADRHCFMKFLIKEIAGEEGFRATFMPAPFQGLEMGSGLHVNISLWNGPENLFPDGSNTRTGLSEIGEHFTAGLLAHAPALTAIACPTVNSYKRLHGTDGTPIISWGVNCRSSMVRIPTNNRIEFRISDGSANPYLLQAALLAAGIDGIQKKLALKEELRHTPDSDKSKFQLLPGTLLEALICLKQDTELQSILGRDIVAGFLQKKREQWDDFMRAVTNWETAQADEY